MKPIFSALRPLLEHPAGSAFFGAVTILTVGIVANNFVDVSMPVIFVGAIAGATGCYVGTRRQQRKRLSQ